MRTEVPSSPTWDRAGKLLAFGLQQEFHSLGEIAKAFLLRFALTVRAGNFKARRPKTAFAGFALMDNSCESFHADNLYAF